jgi:3-oxoadipate enol-lactonase
MPFAPVRDLNLYYEIVGQGPRLLFINGTNADLRRRQPFVDKLSDAFEVLRYDQRGLGQSDKPDIPYSMADYAEDADALMEFVGWDKAAVLGVSFGGMVAQEFALRYPQRVTRLALSCSNPGGKYAYPLLELENLDLETRAKTMLGLDLRRTPEWQASHPEETQRALDEIKNRVKSSAALDGAARMGARRQLEARAQHDALHRLSELKMPVAFFGGRFDGLGTIAAQEAMQAQIPGSTVTLFDGSHGFMSEAPGAVPSVIAFLTSDA